MELWIMWVKNDVLRSGMLDAPGMPGGALRSLLQYETAPPFPFPRRLRRRGKGKGNAPFM